MRLLVESEDERAGRFAEAPLRRDGPLSWQPALYRQVVQMRAMEAPVKYLSRKDTVAGVLKLYARGPTDAVIDRLDKLAASPKEGFIILEIDRQHDE